MGGVLMSPLLTPLTFKDYLKTEKKVTKKHLLNHYQVDRKMLEQILEFWSARGMIIILNDGCNTCSGCYSSETVVESQFD